MTEQEMLAEQLSRQQLVARLTYLRNKELEDSDDGPPEFLEHYVYGVNGLIYMPTRELREEYDDAVKSVMSEDDSFWTTDWSTIDFAWREWGEMADQHDPDKYDFGYKAGVLNPNLVFSTTDLEQMAKLDVQTLGWILKKFLSKKESE